MTDLDLRPRPGAAPARRRVARHARFEIGQLLRNGEQLLLTLVIPVVLLVLMAKVEIVDLGPSGRLQFLVPGMFCLAVLSTAFTGQAIGTGFERRYGVLKRLGSTPLTRTQLLAGKSLAVLAVELGQVALLAAVGVALGWRPTAPAYGVALLFLVVGTIAFAAVGLLMAGTLRAEVTLAAANLVYVLLLLGGGIVVPTSKFPAGMARVLEWLPSSALATGLRSALGGQGLAVHALVVLGVWAATGFVAAARLFRWE